jgi:hypothetical protein
MLEEGSLLELGPEAWVHVLGLGLGLELER